MFFMPEGFYVAWISLFEFGFGNAIIYFVMLVVLIWCYSCFIHNVVGQTLLLEGHFSLFMQSQVLSLLLVGGSRTVLLCLLMIDFTFGIQLQLIFALFQLKSLFSLWCGGKCLSISLKKVLPIFVTTDLRNGGLNQSIFFSVYVGCHWCLFSEMLVDVYNQIYQGLLGIWELIH